MSYLQQTFAAVIAAHRTWLSGFDAQHAIAWERSLADDEEAAVCEAVFREYLINAGVRVAPNVALIEGSRSPDFVCHIGEVKFYVEVTCLTAGIIVEHAGLPTVRTNVYSPDLAGLGRCVIRKCKEKTSQCANLDAPCVVAIGTFSDAAFVLMGDVHIEMLQTGVPSITWEINTETGETSDTGAATDLDNALFVCPRSGAIVDARRPLSAVLVGWFGNQSRRLKGLLHPSAVRPFDRSLLPGIRFCRLRDGYEAGRIDVEWI